MCLIYSKYLIVTAIYTNFYIHFYMTYIYIYIYITSGRFWSEDRSAHSSRQSTRPSTANAGVGITFISRNGPPRLFSNHFPHEPLRNVSRLGAREGHEYLAKNRNLPAHQYEGQTSKYSRGSRSSSRLGRNKGGGRKDFRSGKLSSLNLT